MTKLNEGVIDKLLLYFLMGDKKAVKRVIANHPGLKRNKKEILRHAAEAKRAFKASERNLAAIVGENIMTKRESMILFFKNRLK